MILPEWNIPETYKKILSKAGIQTKEDLSKKSYEDLINLGFTKKQLKKIEVFAKAAFNLKISGEKPRYIPTELDLQIFKLIKHFVTKKEETPTPFWIQKSAAKKLIEKHGFDNLLLVRPKPEVFSLNFYLSFKGQEYIRVNTLKTLKLVERKEEVVEEILEDFTDFTVNNKPKTLSDFFGI